MNPIRLKLGHISALISPEIKFLHNVFTKNNYKLRIAGGAVRDIILDKNPDDIDFATDALPQEMLQMCTKENIRVLNKNGLTHGTVTMRINDKANFEVTTLRIDRNPDGRHCEVEFTKDWLKDAERRDLTINALFIELQHSENDEDTTGLLYDYFNGQEDLKNKKIRFVNNPATRIEEDYLRIFRYFRFFARFTDFDSAHIHDPKVLEIISDRSENLSNISGERLWVEMKKILKYRTCVKVLPTMYECGLLMQIGIVDKINNFDVYSELDEKDFFFSDPDPLTVLAPIIKSTDVVQSMRSRMKISNFELTLLEYLVMHRNLLSDLFENADSDKIIQHFQEFVILSTDSKRMITLSQEAIKLYSVSVNQRNDLLHRWSLWKIPKFPTNGRKILEAWPNVRNRQLAPILNYLKQIWVQSDFNLTEDDLLNESIYLEIVEKKIINIETSPEIKRKKINNNED